MVQLGDWGILNLEGHPNCKMQITFKSYGNFAEWVDLAYRWSFSGGRSEINGATMSVSALFKIFARGRGRGGKPNSIF